MQHVMEEVNSNGHLTNTHTHAHSGDHPYTQNTNAVKGACYNGVGRPWREY